MPPVAKAGGDQSVQLPINVIQLNGSSSSDDLEIISFRWTREDSSLAIGTIVGNSSNEPVFIGKYTEIWSDVKTSKIHFILKFYFLLHFICDN